MAAARGDARNLARMREAVIEARVSVDRMREGLGVTEADLAHERRQLSDAERRGRLAGEIGDAETVTVARQFAAKHAERVAVLEKKLAAQRDEAGLAEREVAEMTEQLKAAERDRVANEAGERVATARARMGGAPVEDAEDERVKLRMDRAAREAAAAEQLEALKRKMGRGKSP